MKIFLTPMEEAIVRLVAEHHWAGIRVDQLEVTRREHTGVGRYTHVIDRGEQPLKDGTYGAGSHFIEMDGVQNGIFFVVEVDKSRISYLEMVTAGGDSWDGLERNWKIT
jgi:hypothetical protein